MRIDEAVQAILRNTLMGPKERAIKATQAILMEVLVDD